MTPRPARPAKGEVARRGDAIYERDVRPRLKARDRGKFVAIDVDTGAYEVDAEELAASHRLRARLPGACVWLVRVGSRYLHRFGGHGRKPRP